MMFRQVGVCAFDLDETFAADGLITASGAVQIGGVRQETDGAFCGILVEEYFEGLTVDERVVR
jgi:hypothetical protein